MNRDLYLRPVNKSRRGQSLIFVSLSMTVLTGLTGLVFDYSVIFCDRSLLDASTQAATLAGAEAMSQSGATTSTVTAAVTSYSSQSGQKNASTFLPNAGLVAGYPAFSCLSTLQTTFSISCYGPSSANAIVVKQQASIPLYFLRIFGAGSVTLTSTATAAMKGASVGPYNVALILDTTASMNSLDASSTCLSTRISCALAGVEVLLKTLSPCPSNQTACGTATGGNVANSVDRVSLLTFPPVTTATLANDYNCGASLPTITSYATPFPATSAYRIVDFSSDYRTSDTVASLNTSTSNLVASVKGKSGTPCLHAVGGYGTYYAQAIYTAQANLVAEKLSYPGSQNVMIILSDGDASAASAAMPGASTSGTYPSTKQECHQAITAAAAATAAGTRVYSVAYGAAASGCSTDTNPSITPCQTMERIASSSAYFYSDYNATGGSSSCISASQPTSSLNKIFKSIGNDLTVARLIPNGTS